MKEASKDKIEVETPPALLNPDEEWANALTHGIAGLAACVAGA